MCDVTHSSHYSLSLFTQLYSTLLQGLRGVAVADSLDYDENYYVPEDYDEDYELFEEPLYVDSFDEDLDDEDFDDEDLDSDVELYGRGPSRSFNPRLKNRAYRQLNNNGRINRNVVRQMNNRQINRVVRADGLRRRDVRWNRRGDLVVRRGAQQWRPPRRRNRPFRRYYD